MQWWKVLVQGQTISELSVLTLATGAECELSCAMVKVSSTGSDNLTELSVLTLAIGAECELSCAMVGGSSTESHRMICRTGE